MVNFYLSYRHQEDIGNRSTHLVQAKESPHQSLLKTRSFLVATDGIFVAPTGEVGTAAWEVAMIIHTVIRHLEKLKLENHKVKPSLGYTGKRS